jgi:hypothetical protein
MFRHHWMAPVLVLAAASLAGCHDTTAPRDHTPPAAPRGVYSVTGDTQVWLHWLANTERDVVSYRIYESQCDAGPGCPYSFVGSTRGTTFEINGLTNGVTRYFAVSALDRAGNESDLSYETVFDTPRPEGFDLPIASAAVDLDHSGYDFSRYSVLPFDDAETDIYYDTSGSSWLLVAPFTDTDIQDMGPTQSFDDVDFAPVGGWSPTGTVEVIPGHAYVVWTYDNHYAKLRVVSANASRIVVDWGYQVDPGNRELRARPVLDAEAGDAGRTRRTGLRTRS